MARRIQSMGVKLIEADNGFGWERKAGSPLLSVHPSTYQTDVFGITYRLVKYGNPRGWFLYLGADAKLNPHFYGEFCADSLLPAIDEASKMIAKADLRGEGYEKKEERS